MLRKLLVLILFFGVLLSGITLINTNQSEELEARKLPKVERKKARYEYFLNKLKDPKTNEIPENARSKEIAFAANMKSGIRALSNVETHNWSELGPSNIGGRTRALALDSRNSDIILIAGVSGGIWKSIDGGTTWVAKLPSGSHLSISFLAQDAVDKDTWYATTGEVANGGSASGKGEGNSFYGSGIYKSTDNGDSWELMTYEFTNATTVVKQTTTNTDIASFAFVSPFRLTSKILIHDFNGTSTFFVCTYFYGIWRSTDGGGTFQRYASSLSNDEDPRYSDIIIDSNDNVTIWYGPTNSGQNGFFRSIDGGASFTNLNPTGYPVAGGSSRAILAMAPSQQDVVYAFVHDNPGTGEVNYFYIFDYSGFDAGGNAAFADRSANLPDFPRSIFGGTEDFTTQGGYDMTLAVHPTNPNLVVLGYVDLIKSEDGFATDITGNAAKFWIGGNENPDRQDEGLDFNGTHHADQHILFFDPNSPNTLFSGHDGGISKTSDITADRVIWESLNNDYNVTQYYTVSIGRAETETQVIGGTQDNGTPTLETENFNGSLVPSTFDVSSGDGSFCYIGADVSYASAQQGALAIVGSNGFFDRFIERSDLNTLFIHPFAVDPNDEGTLFYSSFGDGVLARNTQFDEAVQQQSLNVAENGWEDFNIANAVAMSAIKVSDQNPSHKLYFGGLLGNSPVLFSWEDANTSSSFASATGVDLSSVVADGSYLNDIAINPTDGNEIVLVYSNYNITGLYHSIDGGASLTAIEGNLGTNDDQGASGFTGPSMRAAEIVVDWQGNEKYYVATSIGLFFTEALDGANTVWTLETEALNNVVIEDLDSRPSDNAIVAGTHGRGIFLGQKINLAPVAENQEFSLDENSELEAEVGIVVFAEPENDPVTISISNGNTNDAFAVDNTGKVTINSTSPIDFETNPEFVLTLSISDGELTSTPSLTITLNDINDAPTISDQTLEVNENSGESVEIGTIEVQDQDNDQITFSISQGNDAGFFSLDSSTGLLTVTSTATLDFELEATYTLTISVSDGALTNEAMLTVNLVDVNEAPGIEDQTFEIEEQSANDTVIGTVVSSDPENDQLTYSIKSGNTGDAFIINQNTGELSVSDSQVLDIETNSSFSLVIEISDGEFMDEATITINLTEIVLSVSEVIDRSFKIYPNPVDSYLNVDFNMITSETLTIDMINMSGQQYTLFQGNTHGQFFRKFDVSKYAKGYYILKFKSSDMTLERKVILL